MKIIIEHPGYKSLVIVLPDDYQKPHLPGLKEWVEALRSGNYKQGAGFLCKDGKYCCLGVLCHIQGRLIANKECVIPHVLWDQKDQIAHVNASFLSDENPLFPFFGSNGKIPHAVKVYKGKDENPLRIIGSLAGLNDEGYNFQTIAEAIEHIWKE